jgi:hypothetical protein
MVPGHTRDARCQTTQMLCTASTAQRHLAIARSLSLSTHRYQHIMSMMELDWHFVHLLTDSIPFFDAQQQLILTRDVRSR